jgi:hypothetical protein
MPVHSLYSMVTVIIFWNEQTLSTPLVARSGGTGAVVASAHERAVVAARLVVVALVEIESKYCRQCRYPSFKR